MSRSAVVETDELLSLSVHRKEFLCGMASVSRVIGGRSLPILQHVNLEADSEGLILTGTDLGTWVEHRIESVLVASVGSVSVPVKMLADMVNLLPEGSITLSLDEKVNTRLRLKTGTGSYSINGLSSSEFPRCPIVADDSTFTIDRQVLADSIKHVIFACGTDETRPTCCAILMLFTGDLKMVAMDGAGLALQPCDVTEPKVRVGGSACILPTKASNELLRLLGSEDGEVNVKLSTQLVQFKMRNKDASFTSLVARLIDGRFPNYERAIRAQSKRTVVAQTGELLAAARRAKVAASKSPYRVNIRTSDEFDRLIVTAVGDGSSDTYDEIEIAHDGPQEPLEMAFNANYLAEYLEVIDSEGVRLELEGPLDFAVIKPVGDSGYIGVLVPLQP